MSTQLWQVVDVGDQDTCTVLANISDVPADLQGGAIRQVLEMAGYPYHVENTNILPATAPAAGAETIAWDAACDQAREKVAGLKNGGAH